MFQSSVSIDSYSDQPFLAKVGICFLTAGFASIGSVVLPSFFSVVAGDAKIAPIAIPIFGVFLLFTQLLGWGCVYFVFRDLIKFSHPTRLTLFPWILVTVATGTATILGGFVAECTLAFVVGAFVLILIGHLLAACGKQSDDENGF